MRIRVGDLVIIEDILYELVAIDFNCLAVLKQYYDEGEVIIKEMELNIVQECYENMKSRGVEKAQILGEGQW